MTRLSLSTVAAMMLFATLGSSIANANTIGPRSPSKNEMIKRCMLKSMSARRDLQYNDAAKDCVAQVELQSNTAAPAPTPAKS